MSPRFRLSRLTAALARSLAFAGLVSCGLVARAETPSAAVAAAQLAGVPTSPSFKMTLNKGETGAPEPTAIGAKPIAMKASATRGEEPRAGEAKAGEGKQGAARHGETGMVTGENKAGRKAEDKMGKAADNTAEKAADKNADKGLAKSEGGRADGAAKDAAADPLEVLRQKLAEKLGATAGPGGKFVMRVSNRGESGENVVSIVRPSAAGLAAARRASAHRAVQGASGASMASGDPDANANVAVHGGLSLAPTHWDYEGAGGPDAWGKLKPDYAQCASGTRQSPIDIRGGIAVDLEPIQFDYRPSAFSVVDNGHTVQVNVAPGNFITITGRRYELQQFHFHRPSEERINGRQFDMVAHLVHKDAQGRLAVVAVLLDRGSAQAIVQTVWNNLPLEKGDEVKAATPLDLAQLLPQDKRYYTYMGSLTTPPCSEGVLWMVMKQPVPISPEQVAIFSHLYPMNARPIQQADGRLIKESN